MARTSNEAAEDNERRDGSVFEMDIFFAREVRGLGIGGAEGGVWDAGAAEFFLAIGLNGCGENNGNGCGKKTERECQ